MKIEISTLLTILGITALLGGFYYTTEHRLDSLEAEVQNISKQIKKNKKIRRTK